MSTTHERDDLDGELAAAEAAAAALRAERGRRQQVEASRLDAARVAYDRGTVAAHRGLDEKLQAEASAHAAEFDAAAAAGDLPGAYAAWMAERATRTTRQQVRSAAQSAASRVGGDVLPDLRIFDTDLLERLERVAEATAGQAGMVRAAELLGERP